MLIVDNVEDVAEIINTLSLDQVELILDRQITQSETISKFEQDNFQPIYAAFKQAMKEDKGDEFIRKYSNRYFEICELFIEKIANKFGISCDTSAFEYDKAKLESVAFVMYRFFVMDLYALTKESISNYLEDNIDMLAEVFEDRVKGRKDASTVTSKKYADPKYIGVVSNIPEVIKWVLSNMTTSMFLECCDQEDAIVAEMVEFYEDGVIAGNFMDKLIDIYTEELGFKGQLVVDITFSSSFSIGETLNEGVK